MNAHRKLQLAVLERDNYSCHPCGRYTCETHHVAPRGWFGKNNKEQAWQKKNMLAKCPVCHKPFAHTKAARKRDLEHLERLYGYPYAEQPWVGILGRADEYP
ncbi:MAG TPA: hypothetical protein VMW24_25025 [Sedimentisphaerales bacterium]|nr:hypothetical protein [Sedimentisphaerales bacterium]